MMIAYANGAAQWQVLRSTPSGNPLPRPGLAATLGPVDERRIAHGSTGGRTRKAGASAGTGRFKIRSLGPGLVSGAADTDPTTVATLVVVGTSTMFRLAWLTLLMMPALVVPIRLRRSGEMRAASTDELIRDSQYLWWSVA